MVYLNQFNFFHEDISTNEVHVAPSKLRNYASKFPLYSVSSVDFTELVGLEFGPFTNSTRRQCFNVTINDDSTLETTERFTVALNVTMETTRVAIQPDRAHATVQIVDDDSKSQHIGQHRDATVVLSVSCCLKGLLSTLQLIHYAKTFLFTIM